MANRVHRQFEAALWARQTAGRLTYRCGSFFRNTSKTSWEVFYSKLSLLPKRSPAGKKRWNCRAVKKGIPHIHVDLPPLISVEATGVCIPIGNEEIHFAAVYKSPRRTWTDADIAELLSLRHKCILAGDLNAKHPSWNSAVSNTSGEKLLKFFDRNDFEISAPECATGYSPGGSGYCDA
jgi:hypothetical protein